MLFAAGGIAACLLATPVAVSSSHQQRAAAYMAVRSDEPEEWEIVLIFILELLCEILECDGSPGSGASGAEWITVVSANYTLNGFPPGMSNDEKADARAVIEELYAHLQSDPGGVVNSLQRITFMLLLKSMYADVGGNPGNLGL